MTTRVNIGSRSTGYTEAGGFYESPTFTLNVPKVSNLKKPSFYLPIGGLAVATISSLIIADTTPLIALAESSSHEVGGIISTDPLNRLFHEIYRVMCKVLVYVDTPVIAWAGYNLTLSGTSAEKRSLAKKILIGVFLGTLLVVGSPWIAHQINHLAELMFH